MNRCRGVLAGLLALLPVAGAAAHTADCVDLLYFERPPYYQSAPDGSVGGLVATRVAEVVARAGVCARWRLMPANRHLREVERDRRPLCAVGWFRNPERERIGRFSAPLYRDRPLVAVARAGAGLKSHYPSADELLSRRDLILGVRAGFSYGAALDHAIETLGPRRYASTQSVAEQLAMVARGRVDYIFMGREEADHLLADPRWAMLRRVTFGDLPEGNRRYLLCSRRVPAAWLRAVDAEIEAPGQR